MKTVAAGADPLPAIPAPLTPLVGRRAELALLTDQLATERLVTVLGPGGAGKTTLALEIARRFTDAIVVELAPADVGEVWAAVAGAVARSIRIVDATPAALSGGPRERAIDALAGRTVLIVLDNCEHVSSEAATVALELLRSVPTARILATSREPLGVPGEAFVALGSLPQGDALELFARRVRAARGQAPTAEDEAAVERIVSRLDALPLALELAAAKTRTLSIAEIDAGLDDRFALLATGPRAADPRHQTLRALIDWSWETLTEPERAALLSVAVFPDGFEIADAPEIAEHFDTDAGAFDLLVDRSLLQRANGRFRMLETVREYGLDRLRAGGADAAARVSQAGTMAELSAVKDRLLRGPRVREGLAWFDANDENIAAALRTCASDPHLHATGVLLVRSSLWVWMMRERFDDLQRGITQFGGTGGDTEAAVIVDAIGLLFRTFATFAGFTDEPDADTEAFAQQFEADAVTLAAVARGHRSELSAVVGPLLDAAAVAIRRRSPSSAWSTGFIIPEPADADDLPTWTIAFLAMMRAAMAQNSGDVATLGNESERSLALFRELDDMWGIAFSSQMRSEWLLLQGRLEDALAVADASTDGLAGLTAVTDIIQQRTLGISVLTRLGRFDEARARLADIQALARREGSDRALVQATFTAATVAIAEGDGEAALRDLDAMAAYTLVGAPAQIHAWGASARAQALLLAERTEEARAALREALPAAIRSGDQPILADVVLGVAAWLAATGQNAAARGALAASVRIRGAADETNPSFDRLAGTLGDPADVEPAALEDLVALVG